MHRPITVPSSTSKAANRWWCRCAYSLTSSSRPCFFSGRPGWVRSRAWILLFSSTDRTRLCAGGLTYRPTMSLSLAANSGSLDSLKVLMRWGWRPCAAPDPLHRAQADSDRLRHRPAGPVGGRARRLAEGQVDHPLDHRRRQRRLARRPALVAQQPVDALGHEPFLPPPDRRLGAAHRPHDRKRAHASALSSTIRARSTCFCRLLRSATIASSRARSPAASSISIPLRMPPCYHTPHPIGTLTIASVH